MPARKSSRARFRLRSRTARWSRCSWGANMAADLLHATGLEGGYGRVQVLWGTALSVREGETGVLLGANGAGKTTLIKVLMGLIEAWRGELRFVGEDITHLRTDRRVRAGIAYMSETGCFPGLTVEENIRIGGQFMAAAALRARMAELAGNPRLLIMDEPSAGLSPLFVKEVIRALGGFRGQGLSFLIAEQNVKFLELADRVYTLEGGRIGFEGTVEAMHENDALRRAYFGLK